MQLVLETKPLDDMPAKTDTISPFPRNMMFDSDEPDRMLTGAEEGVVSRLTAEELAAVDAALLELAGDAWRKVALLVSNAFRRLAARLPDLPDVYYSRRVRELVDAGVLESQGNLARMRFSEVRRARAETSDGDATGNP